MRYQQAEIQSLMLSIFQGRLPLTTRNLYNHTLHEHSALSSYSAQVLGGQGKQGAEASENEADGGSSGGMPGSAEKLQLQLGQGAFALDSALMAGLPYLQAAGQRVRPILDGFHSVNINGALSMRTAAFAELLVHTARLQGLFPR
jgi:hypothetical protein